MRKKLPLSEIKEWKNNPRTMTAKRFDALKKSIQDDPELMEKFPPILRLIYEKNVDNLTRWYSMLQ